MIIKRKNKPTVYLMVGCPGSGKSTWIKNNLPNLPVVSRDIIREDLGFCNSGEKIKGTKEQELEVTKVSNQLINKYLKTKQNFVIDDTNINNTFLDPLVKNIKDNNAEVVAIKINTTLNKCIERRRGQIPSDVIKTLWKRVNDVCLDEVDEIVTVNN